jgi:septal ring factor EnvC (AmiA/AmiB activator)
LKESTKKCQTCIGKVEKSFDDWLLFVCELHQASVQREDNTYQMIRANEAHLEAKQQRLSGTVETRAKVEEAVKRMSQVLDTTEGAFKQAAESFPSG